MVDASAEPRQDAAGADSAAKVIKRYANRKLYDTERSCYVTLDEIAQMVKDGEEVQVVDNKTKDDLTAVTLAQIIVEEEKKGSRMPLKLLRNIIKSSNETLTDFYQKRVAGPATQMAHDVERRVGGMFRREDEAAEGEGAPAPEAAAAPADPSGEGDAEEGGPVRAFVASTSEAFDNWQRRIDEQVKETVSKMTHISQTGADVEALRKRIRELEARLASLESKNG